MMKMKTGSPAVWLAFGAGLATVYARGQAEPEHGSKDAPTGQSTEHASEHGEHAAHGPGLDVALQAVNFVLFAALIVFLSRKKIRAFFAEREVGFRQALVKADAAKKEAERKKREIQERLALLESSADASVEQARADSELLKARMLADAEDLRRRFRDDAEATVRIELDRAKAELRAEMIAQAMGIAKTTLSEKIADADQKRLQTEFVEKIQAVGP